MRRLAEFPPKFEKDILIGAGEHSRGNGGLDAKSKFRCGIFQLYERKGDLERPRGIIRLARSLNAE